VEFADPLYFHKLAAQQQQGAAAAAACPAASAMDRYSLSKVSAADLNNCRVVTLFPCHFVTLLL
jgi:hypothetical protein